MKITRLHSVTLFFKDPARDSYNLLNKTFVEEEREGIRDEIKSNALKAGKRDAFKLHARPSRFISRFRRTRFRVKSTQCGEVKSKTQNVG